MGGDPLESIEQLLDMSDIDREKHLTPFRFLFFISEVLFNGALSEAQLVPCVHDDLKCLGRFYFNKDVDDLTPYNGGWFNLSKGNGNENYFNVVGHRAEMTKHYKDMEAVVWAPVGRLGWYLHRVGYESW